MVSCLNLLVGQANIAWACTATGEFESAIMREIYLGLLGPLNDPDSSLGTSSGCLEQEVGLYIWPYFFSLYIMAEKCAVKFSYLCDTYFL
jgi:hypothetical protein